MRQREQECGQDTQYPSEGYHSRLVHLGADVAGEHDGTYVTDLERADREARLRGRHPESFLEGRQHAQPVHPHRADDKDEGS